jgi:very-short-patch-repair endonuclease
VNTNTKTKILCATHGYFFQLPINHINGSRCPTCAKESYKKKRTYRTETFIEKAKDLHGDKYDYSLVDYKKSQIYVDIICKDHGIFKQKPYAHLNGYGCKTCGELLKSENKIKNYDWLKRAKITHGNTYDYSDVIYKKNNLPVKIICDKHGVFEQSMHTHIKGSGCPSCGVMSSAMEDAIVTILEEIKTPYIKNEKSILKNLELDFYIPSQKIAIECNGNYWHSEISGKKDKKYHLNKTTECEKMGIRLIHIFEDEIIEKYKIIKSKIKNLLKSNTRKIYARKCEIKEITADVKNSFLKKYHSQGVDRSKYKYGLFYKKRLVAVMTFCELRRCLGNKHTDNIIELSRYATISSFSIVGGAGKILQYFIKSHTYKKIISYADRRFSTGNLYSKIGFIKIHDTPPNYWYLIKKKNYLIRKHRYNFTKHTIKNKLKNFLDELSEWENMKMNGYDRIWDCGSIKYEYSVGILPKKT